MALDNDCKYILNLGQILVQKYQEDPKIIDEIMCIIQRFNALKNAYISNSNTAISSLQETTKYLNTIHKVLINNHKALNNDLNKAKTVVVPEKSSPKASFDFDSVDIDTLLGNK